MHIVKPIIYTVLYLAFIELIGSWIFIADYFEVEFLIDDYYYFINGLIMAIVLILFTFFSNNRKLRLPQSTSLKWYGLAMIAGLSYVFIQFPLNWIYNLISNDNYYILYKFDGFENFTTINVVSTILLIPIAEELFFREFLQKNLHKQVSSIVAVGLTSILFASIHLPIVSWFLGYASFSFHHAYIALFGGLILGFVYFKSKSIGPPIVMHIFWNLMVTIV